MTTTTPPEATEHLPLRPVEFQILVSLSRGSRHGYAIIQDSEARGEGRAVPGLTTLYRALQRLEDAGLIERSRDDAGEDDPRRRSFVRSDLGRRVTEAEAQRLAALIREAGGTLGRASGPA